MASDRAEPDLPSSRSGLLHAFADLIGGPANRPLLWERRGQWQVGFRWLVTPAILIGVWVARALGFDFAVAPVVAVAGATALYNAVFSWVFRRYRTAMQLDPDLDRAATVVQALCDYVALFTLLHFTGGAWSPLALFLVFHVVITAVQFYRAVAYLFAGLAAGGMWVLLLVEWTGVLPARVVTFRGEALFGGGRPEQAVGFLLVFTSTVFLIALMVGQIMRLLRSRVGKLATTTTELRLANNKLNGLYDIVRSIGSERHLDPILATVTSRLAAVFDVQAVAVHLLSDDGRTMRHVASTGSPDPNTEQVGPGEGDSLDPRVAAGETVVIERPGAGPAALAPLRVEDRVLGALGIYSDRPDRILERDVEFLKLTADLAAIAIEDARTNEAVDALMHERTQFMLEVAHNLRAPLAASLDIVQLLRDGYLGAVDERQRDYLDRIEVRLRALHRTVGRLLTIGRTRDWSREIPDVVVDMNHIASHARSTFERQAAERGLRFEVFAEPDLPAVDSGADLIEQIVENLVSNAIKYTPAGGEVAVRFERSGTDELRIEVRDTGIGIPAAEQNRLFREFFRASNAKKLTSDGTGLGLALVKQSVERHKGRLHLASEEGHGTTVVVHLPVHRGSAAP